MFHGGHLDATYRDEDGDGWVDLVLSGNIEEWDEKGDAVLRTRPCRRVHLWNRLWGRFELPGGDSRFSLDSRFLILDSIRP